MQLVDHSCLCRSTKVLRKNLIRLENRLGLVAMQGGAVLATSNAAALPWMGQNMVALLLRKSRRWVPCTQVVILVVKYLPCGPCWCCSITLRCWNGTGGHLSGKLGVWAENSIRKLALSPLGTALPNAKQRNITLAVFDSRKQSVADAHVS